MLITGASIIDFLKETGQFLLGCAIAFPIIIPAYAAVDYFVEGGNSCEFDIEDSFVATDGNTVFFGLKIIEVFTPDQILGPMMENPATPKTKDQLQCEFFYQDTGQTHQCSHLK